MSLLYKECELRRHEMSREDGPAPVQRMVRWLPADVAAIGRVVSLEAGERWEIVSAPEPALPEGIVRRFGAALTVIAPSLQRQ